MNEGILREFERLNDEQREAVETVDGPLLVVAGPGTGKTQLLSLRAANILAKRDVAPENILCLTYTRAGAEAMSKRLVRLIGRSAYGIEVSTFHGFASQVRARYPERFGDGLPRGLVSDLERKKILDGLLKRIRFGSPLYAGTNREGVNAKLGDVEQFVSRFKKSGLTTAELRAIQQQSLDFFAYAREESELFDILDAGIPSAKAEYCARFEEEVERLVSAAPRELTSPVIPVPGIYIPYALYLRDAVRSTEFLNESGTGAPGFRVLRGKLFKKESGEGYRFKDEKRCLQAIEVAKVIDEYEADLERRGLYDYDDMILDTIRVLEEDEGFRRELQERYRYIQVDEFQDTNGSQLRIVELLTEGIENPNVMVVGDDDQAIMRFQGASIECVAQFAERYHPKSVVLKTNYRSTPSIVALGQEVAAQIETRLPASEADKRIVACRQDDGQTEFAEHVFADQDTERFELARDIRRRLDEGFPATCANPDEAIAVIARKHASLQALIPCLQHFGIPFTYVYTSEVSQLEPMQTMLACLRFVVARSRGRDEAAEAELPQIVASPEVGAPSSAVWFAIDARRNQRSWLRELRETDNKRLVSLRERLEKCAGRAGSAPVRELVHELAAPIARYYREHAADDPLALAEFQSGIRALLEFVEGELASAAPQGRTLRLGDVMDLYEQTRTYGQKIDAAVSLGHEGAVRLTTAHGSKGLEFDLVYVLDSDDTTWHGGGSPSGFYAANMLDTDEAVEDDARRLLFVALTRARSEIELYRGRGSTVRELQGLVSEDECEPDPVSLADAIEASWKRSYELDTPELRALVEPDLAAMRISASALNQFVEVDGDGLPQTEEFPQQVMMRLPSKPAIWSDFGICVHAFFEAYVDHVLRGGDAVPDELAAAYRQQVLWMDYPEGDVERCAERFDHIVESFLPWLDERLRGAGRLEAECRVKAVLDDEVPLTGRCDLLIVDDDAREVEVGDYKTGLTAWERNGGTAYERQLQFYRLLLESSAEFEGYRVTDSADWYVEPDRKTGELHEPSVTAVTDEQLGHLRELVRAVWHRIQAGAFDVSAYLESDERAEALAEIACTKKRKTKDLMHRIHQAAFEDWLIAQDR